MCKKKQESPLTVERRGSTRRVLERPRADLAVQRLPSRALQPRDDHLAADRMEEVRHPAPLEPSAAPNGQSTLQATRKVGCTLRSDRFRWLQALRACVISS